MAKMVPGFLPYTRTRKLCHIAKESRAFQKRRFLHLEYQEGSTRGLCGDVFTGVEQKPSMRFPGAASHRPQGVLSTFLFSHSCQLWFSCVVSCLSFFIGDLERPTPRSLPKDRRRWLCWSRWPYVGADFGLMIYRNAHDQILGRHLDLRPWEARWVNT